MNHVTPELAQALAVVEAAFREHGIVELTLVETGYSDGVLSKKGCVVLTTYCGDDDTLLDDDEPPFEHPPARTLAGAFEAVLQSRARTNAHGPKREGDERPSVLHALRSGSTLRPHSG